jgi:predicted Zn-ribbon and HTH transcriptional regulator
VAGEQPVDPPPSAADGDLSSQAIAERFSGTLRQRMIAVLQERFMDQHELSQALGVREKEVVLHLPHIAKTTAGRKLAWQVRPAYCEACRYVFKDRRRLTPPSKCPRCRESRIRGPWFKVSPATKPA